ncbi:unnamed protein product [Cyprideis torosa]|uniref:ARHGAP20 PH domain-containing protein n=1 Tax=Cyprideis torosa TaxID=163714 RepID=A0A7R8W7A0_9CRUS|nr:unnamed protein product [Cyprideis torosa]CAG0886046.1 unnamed protein product [Cyprideis torosa]
MYLETDLDRVQGLFPSDELHLCDDDPVQAGNLTPPSQHGSNTALVFDPIPNVVVKPREQWEGGGGGPKLQRGVVKSPKPKSPLCDGVRQGIVLALATVGLNRDGKLRSCRSDMSSSARSSAAGKGSFQVPFRERLYHWRRKMNMVILCCCTYTATTLAATPRHTRQPETFQGEQFPFPTRRMVLRLESPSTALLLKSHPFGRELSCLVCSTPGVVVAQPPFLLRSDPNDQACGSVPQPLVRWFSHVGMPAVVSECSVVSEEYSEVMKSLRRKRSSRSGRLQRVLSAKGRSSSAGRNGTNGAGGVASKENHASPHHPLYSSPIPPPHRSLLLDAPVQMTIESVKGESSDRCDQKSVKGESSERCNQESVKGESSDRCDQKSVKGESSERCNQESVKGESSDRCDQKSVKGESSERCNQESVKGENSERCDQKSVKGESSERCDQKSVKGESSERCNQESVKASDVIRNPSKEKAGPQSQERHFFLFSDLLVVAKPKAGNQFRLKEMVLMANVWLSLEGAAEVIEVSRPRETSFVIGWPTKNAVVTFTVTTAGNFCFGPVLRQSQGVGLSLGLAQPPSHLPLLGWDPSTCIARREFGSVLTRWSAVLDSISAYASVGRVPSKLIRTRDHSKISGTLGPFQRRVDFVMEKLSALWILSICRPPTLLSSEVVGERSGDPVVGERSDGCQWLVSGPMVASG